MVLILFLKFGLLSLDAVNLHFLYNSSLVFLNDFQVVSYVFTFLQFRISCSRNTSQWLFLSRYYCFFRTSWRSNISIIPTFLSYQLVLLQLTFLKPYFKNVYRVTVKALKVFHLSAMVIKQVISFNLSFFDAFYLCCVFSLVCNFFTRKKQDGNVPSVISPPPLNPSLSRV